MSKGRQNRRQLLKRVGFFGALAALLSPTAALARSNTPQASANTPGVGGSWRVTFTPEGSGPAPFQALHTFSGDGTVTTAEQRDQVPPTLASPGHGAWTALPSSDGPDDFAYDYQKLLVDTQGNLVGTQHFHLKIELTEGGQAFKGSGTSVIQDTTGNSAAPDFPIMLVGRRLAP